MHGCLFANKSIIVSPLFPRGPIFQILMNPPQWRAFSFQNELAVLWAVQNPYDCFVSPHQVITQLCNYVFKSTSLRYILALKLYSPEYLTDLWRYILKKVKNLLLKFKNKCAKYSTDYTLNLYNVPTECFESKYTAYFWTDLSATRPAG